MARKKKHEEHVNHERWLISYADFITLLFAFFVVMFSVSQVDSNKVGKFSESFAESMGVHVLAGSTGVFDGYSTPFTFMEQSARKGPKGDYPKGLIAVEASLSGIAKKKKKEQPTFDISMLGLGMGKGRGGRGRGGKGKGGKGKGGKGKGGKGVGFRPHAGGGGTDKIPKAVLAGLRILRRRTELVLRLDIDVLFKSGSDIVDPDAVGLLRLIGEELKKRPVELKVEGHTDDKPINSTRFRSNWHLSTARATAVILFFVEKMGFPPDRLGATGFGEYRPIASNKTVEGRSKNRRVDIVVGMRAKKKKKPKKPTRESSYKGDAGTKTASSSASQHPL